MAKRECLEGVPGYISQEDLKWVLDKAALALDLDAFVTVQADRDRLTQIRTELA